MELQNFDKNGSGSTSGLNVGSMTAMGAESTNRSDGAPRFESGSVAIK